MMPIIVSGSTRVQPLGLGRATTVIEFQTEPSIIAEKLADDVHVVTVQDTVTAVATAYDEVARVYAESCVESPSTQDSVNIEGVSDV